MKNKKHVAPAPQREAPDGIAYRSVALELIRAEGQAEPQVRMSISSEMPVLTHTVYNDTYQRVFEILDHSPGSIDMSRAKDGLVIQDTHWGDQIGLMECENKDRKLGGIVRFCTGERAQEIAQDAAKGLRRNVSVGYRVDASSYKPEGEKDGIPVVRAMSWMPYEASFVPIPADTSVGVGRAAQVTDVEQPKTEPKTRNAKMETKIEVNPNDVVEIYRLARAYDMEPGMADDHIKSGGTLDAFRVLALKKGEEDRIAAANVRKPDLPVPAAPAPILTSREAKEVQKRYNFGNVIKTLSGVTGLDIAFEREVSAELGKRSGKSVQGLLMPHDALIQVRADPFLSGSNGSNMVATNLLPMIEALRTKMVLARAGVTIMSGLTGDVAIPKGGTITGGWVDGENGTGTEGKPTLGQITGTTHTASAYTDISRKLLIQSSIDAQMYVQNEQLNTIARLIEVACFAGTNANGQPKGLPSWSGINNPSISVAGTPTWLEILTFLSDIESDNAAMDGMSWIMTPAVMAKLASLPKTATYGDNMILNIEQKQMAGFPYQTTMNATTKSLWLGVWSQLVIGLWTGVDVIVDPYTGSSAGTVRVVSLQDCDVMVRHPQAFAYNTAVLA